MRYQADAGRKSAAWLLTFRIRTSTGVSERDAIAITRIQLELQEFMM
jgi:hypothetical protein